MAKERIPQTQASLRELIRDPVQLRDLQVAFQLVATKLASLDKLRTEGGMLEPAALQSHMRASKEVLDSLRTQIAILGEREAQSLGGTHRGRRARRQRELFANIGMAAVGSAERRSRCGCCHPASFAACRPPPPMRNASLPDCR